MRDHAVWTGPRRLDLVAVLIGLGFALMWSSAFSVVKIALQDAPPFLILTLRFLVSGLIAVMIAWALGQRMPGQRRQWLAILVLGLCQNSLYLGLNFKAMTLVPAGLAAILASSVPLIVALFCRVFLKERLGWVGYAGLAFGFAGVLTIMVGRVAGGESGFGILLCLIGAMAMASATLIVRNTDLGSGLLMIVGLQMLVGSASLAPVVFLLEDLDGVRLTMSLALAFTYVTLVPGVIATLVWFYLVRRIGATHAAAFHFLNPAFGVIIANLLLGELIGLRDVIGVLIIMASILAVQLARPKQA
ncbi:MAG: DMT family transporter [Geminicoccaceae bacterium]